MNITIRKFEKRDIPDKVRWVNDARNNVYLHYDLPLEIAKTEKWFENNKDRVDRYDAIIEVDNISVGLIGLLNIDQKNKKAEYYISMGEVEYKGKGIATQATRLLLDYAFVDLKLEKIFLYTEKENIGAQRLFEKLGFEKEGLLKNDLYHNGRFVERYVYGILKDFYPNKKQIEKGQNQTSIQFLGKYNNNDLYIKREDMIPFSFGGNKARKAKLFFDEIDNGNFDCVVTYGSSSSNHCRVVANMAVARQIQCYIISPEEASKKTFNSKMMKEFGAQVTIVPVCEVHNTIERKLETLKQQGLQPYFIAGGGHGNIGTQAFVECYEEICEYERLNHVKFDYIFHASGTGTTQAGLICGQLIRNDDRKIIGISIARTNPRGRDVVLDSVTEYLNKKDIHIKNDMIEQKTIFIDEYVGEGYGKTNLEINEIIREVLCKYGIPLDSTYTGKAFWGMKKYFEEKNICGKKVLFLHTGGTPLYFDNLSNMTE